MHHPQHPQLTPIHHPQLQTLEGHQDEIFSCAFNYEGDFVITGSKDNTCRIWKAETATSQVRAAVAPH